MFGYLIIEELYSYGMKHDINFIPDMFALTGNSSLIAGASIITGNTTLYTTEISANDYIYFDSQNYIVKIKNISSDTQAILVTNSLYTISSEICYKIVNIAQFQDINLFLQISYNIIKSLIGNATVDDDVKLAQFLLAKYIRENPYYIKRDLKSYNVGEISYTYDKFKLPKNIESLLKNKINSFYGNYAGAIKRYADESESIY